MKFFVILASLILSGSHFIFAAEETELSSLPVPVQKTARAEVGSAKIEEVEDTFEDGKRAYEVEFERDGRKLAIVIAPDGRLIQLEHRLSVGDVPAKIKEAIAKQFSDGKISHLKQVDKGGKTYFELTVEAGGKSHALKLNAEGKPLESGAKD